MTEQIDSKTEFVIKPVGIVKSEIKEQPFRPKTQQEADAFISDTRSYYQRVKHLTSELIIDSVFSELLDGVEAYSHIMVLYWPHLLPEKNRSLKKVHPMGRRDVPLQGIFATRSPVRPNPVLVSNVQLLERNQNVLRVRGLEALDGSPIVDIKPVTRLTEDTDAPPKAPEWMAHLHQDLDSDE